MKKYLKYVLLCFFMMSIATVGGMLSGALGEGLAASMATSDNVTDDVMNDAIGALLLRSHISTLSTPMYYEETAFSSVLGKTQLTTRRVWQAAADRFRVETVDETGRMILTISDGSQIWVVDTATQAVLREQRADIPFRPLGMEPGDRGRMAQGVFGNRPVHIVALRRDRQTHTYTMDSETGILLKEEIVGHDGELVYMAYRSNLRLDVEFDPVLFVYHPSPDQQVTHDRNAWRTQRIVQDLSTKSGFAVHVPKLLPDGYELLDGNVHYVEDDAVVSLHFRKDTAVLSIFQQEHPITNGMIRQLVKRLTSASTSASTSRRELAAATKTLCGRSFLAIGPLTERELERVLNSIECMDDHPKGGTFASLRNTERK